MTQTMIGVVVCLAAVLVVVAVMAGRYMRDHKGEIKGDGMAQWLDTHHMGWMHHRH